MGKKLVGVDRLPSGKYRARVLHEGRQVSLGTFFTLGDAETALQIARGEIAARTFVSPSVRRRQERDAAAKAEAERVAQTYTVADLYKDWMAWQERRGLKMSTLYTRKRRYQHDIEPRFGAVSASEVTVEAVTAWYDEIRERAKGTAHEVLATFSQMFSYGTGQAAHLPAGFVAKVAMNPCKITTPGRRKKVKPPHREIATPEEVSALAGGMPDKVALAVLLAAWCGLRIGEVLGLRRRDFWTAKATRAGEKDHLVVKIERQVQARGGGLRKDTVKSEASNRDVPVPDALVRTVKAHLRDWAGMGPDGLLFPREVRGRSFMHPNTLRYHFEASLDAFNAAAVKDERPDLKGFVFHDLRKTALTRVGRAGATGAELMRWGGHVDLEAVQIYQRADLDGLARIADTMDADVVVPGVGEVSRLRVVGL